MLQARIDLGEIQTSARQFTKAAGAAYTQLVSDNPRRLALVISSDGTNSLRVSFNPNSAAGEGILLPANQWPLILTRAELGDALTREIYCAGSGAYTVTVWEVEDSGP